MNRQPSVGYAERRREQGTGAVARLLRRRSLIAASAAAGIAGPLVFTVAFLVQGWLRSGEYSAVAEIVSALEAGPGGGFSR